MKPEQQTEYIVQALRMQGAMYEDDARQFLAEHDDHVRTTALTEAKVEVVAWLVKKAAEDTPVCELASKVDRGAVRIFLGTGHYRDAMDAHRAEGARLIEDAACDADWNKSPDYCAGLRAGAELLLANTGEKATAAAATATPDTLAKWLYLRFMTAGEGWDSLTQEDREYWEHEARAVRRAVARGGFRTPTPEAGDR